MGSDRGRDRGDDRGEPTVDVITMGRVSMDLFSQQVGADMPDVRGFDAMVGGSPSNIAIGTARLGARVAVLTAVGDDEVGRFVVGNLEREGVSTAHVKVVPEARTGLAILGVQPPDTFPLTFYRENPADVHLDTADVDALPLGATRVLQLSGAALSRGTCAHATLHAGQRAAALPGTTVVLDLDLRPDQWTDAGGYGAAVRALLPSVDVVIGTEEEFHAALAPLGGTLSLADLDANQRDQLGGLVDQAHGTKPSLVTVLKRGSRGVRVRDDAADEPVVDVVGYAVTVANTVGAGDAFASGLIHGFLQGWDWAVAARFGNACGAIEVTRAGCSVALPTVSEVTAFMEAHR